LRLVHCGGSVRLSAMILSNPRSSDDP
jgi:hypothetical protein